MKKPKNQYAVVWTNRRPLEDGSFEDYEVVSLLPTLPKAKETFDLLVEHKVNPCWMVDLHTGIIKEHN